MILRLMFYRFLRFIITFVNTHTICELNAKRYRNGEETVETMCTSSLLFDGTPLMANIKKKASQNMLPHACDASRFIHL
ncbi:unknown [Bacteroides sp. CAG:702]|nr:unknown [Bacteroides sp. CAG:702]